MNRRGLEEAWQVEIDKRKYEFFSKEEVDSFLKGVNGNVKSN